MVARGTIVLSTGSKTLNLTGEKVNVRAGLVNKNLPFLSSAEAWQASIWGRGREIVLEGWYAGTQAQIEAWLEFFEDWCNETASLQKTGKYYPMFHKDNQVNGSQANYWNVMVDDFEYSYEEEAPTKITFAITLREGTKLGAFSVLSGETT